MQEFSVADSVYWFTEDKNFKIILDIFLFIDGVWGPGRLFLPQCKIYMSQELIVSIYYFIMCVYNASEILFLFLILGSV